MEAVLITDFHDAQFEFNKKSISVQFANGDDNETILLEGELGKGIIPEEKPQISPNEDYTSVTFSWPKFGSLLVNYKQFPTGSEYKIQWIPQKTCPYLRDVFDMRGAHWYGVGQIKRQTWPIDKWQRKEMPFVTGDFYKNQYSGVQERYWLSSRGFAIYVEHSVPLFVSMNYKKDGQLSLCSKWANPYRKTEDDVTTLCYRIFASSNIKKVHILATEEVFCKPNGIPNEDDFRYPIWSTWAKYRKNISEKTVMEFARDIKNYGFKASRIVIDDDWTLHYGDMEFDHLKFPNPKKMIEKLYKLGFEVTLWVHPFASINSNAVSHPYWLKTGILGGYSTWWNGVCKTLDVTNPEAVEWFKRTLLELQRKYHFVSFRFDAGEAYWLPSGCYPLNSWKNPNEYTSKYCRMWFESSKTTNNQMVKAFDVRVGINTQHLPVFVRVMNKDPNWSYDNGLRCIIPCALTFSVLGYPFILPDAITGIGFEPSRSSSKLPEKCLFIRWLQASVFLPTLQFSISPWQYDDDVVKICRDLTELHEKFADTIIDLARESVQTGAPIIRPLWWVAPEDIDALKIDDEFLLGDDILVAPVLDKNAEERDIYLPCGLWRDQLRKTIIEGGKWYRNYEAKLDELPYFMRHLDEIVDNEEQKFSLKTDVAFKNEPLRFEGSFQNSDVPDLISDEEVRKVVHSKS